MVLSVGQSGCSRCANVRQSVASGCDGSRIVKRLSFLAPSIEKQTVEGDSKIKHTPVGYIRVCMVMENVQISICGTDAPYPLMQKAKNSISQNCAVTWIKMLLHLRGKRKQARARVNQQGYKYRSLGTLRTVLRFKRPHTRFLHLTTTFHFSNKPSHFTQHGQCMIRYVYVSENNTKILKILQLLESQGTPQALCYNADKRAAIVDIRNDIRNPLF